MLTINNSFDNWTTANGNALGDTLLDGIYTIPAETNDGRYAARFKTPLCKGHRIVLSADVLAESDSAQLYFQIYDENNNRLDSGSVNHIIHAKTLNQWHRMSLAVEATHPKTAYVICRLGKLQTQREDGFVHKFRNPCVQIDSVAGVHSDLTELPTVAYLAYNDGDYRVYVVGKVATFTIEADVDLSQSVVNISAPSSFSDFSVAKRLGGYWSIARNETGLLPDAQYISQIFLRCNASLDEFFKLYNANPRPDERIVKMVLTQSVLIS